MSIELQSLSCEHDLISNTKNKHCVSNIADLVMKKENADLGIHRTNSIMNLDYIQ